MRKFILAHSKKNFLNILDAEHAFFAQNMGNNNFSEKLWHPKQHAKNQEKTNEANFEKNWRCLRRSN